MKVKNQLLISKNQVIACKDALMVQAGGELQQYRRSSHPAESGSSWQPQNSSSSSFEGATPLDKDEMLDQVLLYVGGGEHIFVAGVNRRWRGIHTALRAERHIQVHQEACD
jgi:hypothetical protein